MYTKTTKKLYIKTCAVHSIRVFFFIFSCIYLTTALSNTCLTEFSKNLAEIEIVKVLLERINSSHLEKTIVSTVWTTIASLLYILYDP